MSALVRLDLALRPAGLVALGVALVLALDAGLEEVVPLAVESKFAATAIVREASLALDLTALVVEGFSVALESVLADAAFFLGGMIVGELVRVIAGWVLGDTVDQVLNHDCFYRHHRLYIS